MSSASGSVATTSTTASSSVTRAPRSGVVRVVGGERRLGVGAEIRLESAEPAAGQFTVRLNGSTRAVGEKAAAGLFVRRAA